MIRLTVLLAGVLTLVSAAATRAGDPAVDPARVDAVTAAMFAKASPEWQARLVQDETQRQCTATRNQPAPEAAAAIRSREAGRVVLPAGGIRLGDWKKGHEIANSGRGGQFSDPPGTVAGGNCYACHQLDPREGSYGTRGPSLAGYGKGRDRDPEALTAAYIKLYDSQVAVACSNMPRFGAMGVLTEAQILDALAYLFVAEWAVIFLSATSSGGPCRRAGCLPKSMAGGMRATSRV